MATPTPTVDNTVAYTLNGKSYNKAGGPVQTTTVPASVSPNPPATPTSASPSVLAMQSELDKAKQTLTTMQSQVGGVGVKAPAGMEYGPDGKLQPIQNPAPAKAAFISPNDQKTIAGSVASSGADTGSAGAMRTAFDTASAATDSSSSSATDPMTAAMSGDSSAFSSLDPGVASLITGIQNQLTTLNQNPPESFLNYYNNLASTQGIPALDAQAVNLQNIINGTENDVRNEITASGGFATESQVQGIVASRNKVITNQLNAILNLRQSKVDYVNNQVSLYQEDQQTASNRFNQLTGLEDRALTLQNTINNSQFTHSLDYQKFTTTQRTAALNDLVKMSAGGGLTNLTQSDIDYYSQATGIDPSIIANYGKNTASKAQFNQQLLIAKIKAASMSNSLSPNALNILSSMFLQTGNIPSLGYGAAGAAEKAQVINTAAQTAASTGQDGTAIVLNAAGNKADVAALGAITKVQATATAAETKALANFDMLRAQSAALTRDDSQFMNKYQQWIQGTLGAASPDLIAKLNAFQGLVKTTATEYANVVFAKGGASAVTQGANEEIQSILNPAMGDGTINAVLDNMTQEMKNSLDGFSSEINTIQGRMQQRGNPPDTSTPAGADTASYLDSLGVASSTPQ